MEWIGARVQERLGQLPVSEEDRQVQGRGAVCVADHPISGIADETGHRGHLGLAVPRPPGPLHGGQKMEGVGTGAVARRQVGTRLGQTLVDLRTADAVGSAHRRQRLPVGEPDTEIEAPAGEHADEIGRPIGFEGPLDQALGGVRLVIVIHVESGYHLGSIRSGLLRPALEEIQFDPPYRIPIHYRHPFRNRLCTASTLRPETSSTRRSTWMSTASSTASP